MRVEEGQSFIKNVRRRLKDDAQARKEREKRRRRVMLEQLEAHEAQEEVYREEQLVTRLMRQSLQERRVIVQLMHVRHEKHVMVQNRIFREKQYEEQRLKEFRQSLDREEVLARQERVEQAERREREREVHERLMADWAERRFRRHYQLCQEVVAHILDLVTTVSEYRQLTQGLIPSKVMREWKELFFTQMPIFEQPAAPQQASAESPEDSIELAKQHLLNTQDYEDYQLMRGEWQPPADGDIHGPPPNNNVLGHAVNRIIEAAHPTKEPSPPPQFPPFPIKACILGKLHAGKTTCLKHLAQALNIRAISPETLLQEAVRAFDEGETADPGESQGDEAEAGMEKVPSARAQLGEHAANLLRKGKSVPDELLVEMVTECLRRLPAECGWILDGFPVTITQAKLLEKALTGLDPDNTMPKTKRSRTKLAVDPKASKEPPPPQPALDIAILLEVSDNTVLARHSESTGSAQRPGAEQRCRVWEVSHAAGAEIQKPSSPQELQETPDVGESLSPEEEQLLPRLTGFLDNWSKLEKWFEGQQQILVKVNGELEWSQLLEKLEFVLVNALFKKHTRDAGTEKPSEITTPAQAETSPSQGPQETAPKDGNLAGSGSASGLSSAKEKTKVSLGDKQHNKSGSISQAGSAKGKKAREQKGKSEPPPSELTSEPDNTHPPPPKPGSDQWVYVDEPVPQEIVEYLSRYWSSIEETYTSTIHSVMQQLRGEQHRIIHGLHALRKDFQEYLETRPDHKQEFVSQWQEDYNSMADDLRGDEDVKAELMLRLYTLRECLWDISDKRKEEAERERQNMMRNGWLQDHLAILLNFYTTLMQAEVDRFQDTARFLQDYYKGMEGKIPLENSKEFARIPLVNVADVQLPTSASQDIRSVPDSSQPDGQRKPETSGSGTRGEEEQEGEREGGQELKQFRVPDSSQPDGQRKPETSGSGTRGEEEQEGEREGGQELKQFRVPLVPYRIPSSSLVVKEKSKSPVKVTGKAKEEVVLTDAPPITNVDEYLIFEAYHTAASTLSNIIQREVKVKEDEEKKEQKLKEDKERDQQKSSSGKDRKKKSADKKKGPRSTTPLLPTLVENPEEIRRRELRERIYAEYFGALEDEAAAVTTRLDLIKLKAVAAIEDLKSQAGHIFTSMEDWLGSQFLQEMDSIAALLTVGLEHVRAGTKIKLRLELGSKEFFVNGDVRLVASPAPPPRLPSEETPTAGELTIRQLWDLLRQFRLLLPTGLMTRRVFIETLQDLISQDLGSDHFPEPWCSVTYPQLVEVSRVLAPDSDFLDWRQFLLSIAQPWPYPSLKELLDTKMRLQAVDQAGSGLLTQEQYDQVKLWFTGDTNQQVPEDPVEPIPFDRLGQLKKVFFAMFADSSVPEPRLDYNNMLLYFSGHPNPAQGLHQALSITLGAPLPWTPPSTSSLLKSEPCAPQHVPKRSPMPDGSPTPDESLTLAEKVPLSALFQVVTHGVTEIGDIHRHRSQDEEWLRHCKHFTQVYKELGSKELEPLPFNVLLKHPVIMDFITNTALFSQPDVWAVVQKWSVEGEGVANSSPEPSVEMGPSTPTDDTGPRQSRRRVPRV
ncbi:sperm flagellar protein 2-like [Pristis pectinata]|uniref:sperm flagellar protein 2-like n=1 Tax=Pristis pectinata TaxID=685728 RepID=UPI00223DFACF|nr:sperm flagellar protein 2-like [Pristis pectinata]